ncbi:Pkinase-domain-containing protein [Backusella circina FSU 941]|nr:Pkinase-domain-containing protein [Backusella circina FSU 941]
MSSSSSPQSAEKERTVGEFVIQENIGQGSFASVYKAQHKIDKRIVAVKSVLRSKLTKKLLENLESEINILTSIRHPNIVGLIECQKTNSHIYLVMEYCSMGDLSNYIKKIRTNKALKSRAGGLPERTVRHFLKQLANALQFLRSQNLVHRDIKPQNLLLIESQDHDPPTSDLPILKIADFGFARFLPNASLADTLCGSPLYMGPEILSYKKYDAKADLWSVGAVLYEMITGRPPFRAQNHLELLKKIQESNDQIPFPDEKNPEIHIGDDLKDLVRKLLKKDPVERLSFEEFFLHPAVLQQQQQQQPQRSQSPRPSSYHPPSTMQKQRPIPQRSTSRPPSRLMESPENKNYYEPPPFAHTPRQLSERRQSNAKRSDRTKAPENGSPLHSNSRPTKFESSARDSYPWTPSPSEPTTSDSGTQQQRRRRDEEDMLQEYVVIDRKIIETNQFADELNASPRTDMTGRRLSTTASPNTTHAVNIPTRTNISPSAPFVRERRVSANSAGSAGSALAKALSMASVRLFGHTMPSPPSENQLLTGSPRGFMTMNHGSKAFDHRRDSADNNDEPALMRIEKAACMAHAVAKYGDQKFEALSQEKADENTAEEGFVLHIKALALLELGLDLARTYWQQQEDEENERKNFARLNDAVQWMRERFNGCLERASVENGKLDPASPRNIIVDKLIFDRALEMSRAAAVHELTGENVTTCEQDYQTGIWMLESILQGRSEDDAAVEDDDKRIINKFIDSIRHRITVLRKKMEVSERI